MKSFLSILVLLLCFSTATLLCEAQEQPAKINVGIILPLTGETAAIGYSVKNGIDMGYESLPPKLRERISLHFEDDGFQPKNSVSALTRLMTDKQIDILINPGSSTSNSLAPIAESNHIPFIAIATDPKVSAGRQYVFNFWVNADSETALVLPEMERRGYRSIARISTIHDMMTAVRKSFDDKNSGKISLSIDEEYAPDARDFKPFLSKVRAAKKSDAILALLFPGQIGTFAKQAREMGITVPLVGYEFFEDPGEVAVSHGALVDQWFVNADEPEEMFAREYKAKFPKAATFGAANGYDSIKLIAAAVEKGIAPSEFNTFLKNLKDFKGALGTYSAVGNNGFTLPATLKVVTATGFDKLEPL